MARTEGRACGRLRLVGDLEVGEDDKELSERLSHELIAFNVAATGEDNVRGMSVRVDDDGGLVGGLSGWTWGTTAGIELLWVRADSRGTGLGSRLLAAAEAEARRRGCTQVVLTSFTFQAPDFYKRLGFEEYARDEGIPTAGHADVRLRKRL